MEFLQQVLGIGRKRAEELTKKGVRDIKDLEKKEIYETLTDEIKLFLKLKPLRSIPHDLIADMEKKFKTLHPLEITGSYRRNKPFSRDLDVVMRVRSKKEVVEFIKQISGQIYNDGEKKMSLFFPWKGNYYKMDIFITNKDEYEAIMLYSTGSKENNIRMRAKAKSQGLLLNQYGLFKKGEKINLKTEKDYYDYLGMKYLEPHER